MKTAASEDSGGVDRRAAVRAGSELTRSWLAELDQMIGRLDEVPFRDVQHICHHARAKLDALEAHRLAETAGDDRSRARRIATDPRRSRRTARRVADRAGAIAANGRLADDLSSGRLSGEQLDTIADAMQTDPAAATDQQLIDAIADSTVDQGRSLARDWTNRRADRDKLAAETERQRRHRNARRWRNRKLGLTALTIEGDDHTVNELWHIIAGHERRLWHTDGGREPASGGHHRTRNQRLFDAATDLIRGIASREGTTSNGIPPGRQRPSVVVTVPLPPSTGPGTAQPPLSIGEGPISDDDLRALLSRADLSIAITDALTASPIAFGRARRTPTLDQYLALVIRDRGCVLCGRHWLFCEMHHIAPTNAPVRGPTDLTNLALLCSPCHHDLHADNRTLVVATDNASERTDSVRWTTRPATAHETPSRRHHPP